MGKQKNELILQDVIVHYMLSFKHLCLVTVLCPLAALLICFVTAYIFQYDDIHETHCRVSLGGFGYKAFVSGYLCRCTILFLRLVQLQGLVRRGICGG